MKRILAAFAVLCALGFAPGLAVAQSGSFQVLTTCGTANYPATQLRSGTQDTTGKICTSGSGGGGGSNAAAGPTGAAVPTSAGYTGLNFGGNLKGWTGDTNGYGDVNVMNVPGINITQIGGTSVTAGGGFPVNIVAGGSVGSFNNNADAVATSSTNGQSAAWLYGYNGTTWDRLRVDGSKILEVDVTAGSISATFSGSLPSGTNPLGGVTQVGAWAVTNTPQGGPNYANAANFIGGTASTTAGTATTLVAASGAGLKSYITDLSCYNTSATTITVALNDSLSSVFIVPAGGGFVLPAQTPLITAANTALTFTASTAETTVGCTARGYKAS